VPIVPRGQARDPVNNIYSLVLGVSMSALGLFLAFNLVWRVVGEESLLGVADSIKDAVVVVALVLLAPYVYNATAQALNTISYIYSSSISSSCIAILEIQPKTSTLFMVLSIQIGFQTLSLLYSLRSLHYYTQVEIHTMAHEAKSRRALYSQELILNS